MNEKTNKFTQDIHHAIEEDKERSIYLCERHHNIAEKSYLSLIRSLKKTLSDLENERTGLLDNGAKTDPFGDYYDDFAEKDLELSLTIGVVKTELGVAEERYHYLFSEITK